MKLLIPWGLLGLIGITILIIIYIIKPNQSRYWSYSAACKDADEIYADIMATKKKNNE